MMYQNLAWPGAYSFKGDIKLFIKCFKELFDGLLEKIEDTEKAISAGD